MESLGKFPRVLNGVPRANIEGPPRDFPRAKPEGNPKGDLQYPPEGLHLVPRGFPRDSIHHDTPKGFSQIIIITMYWTSSRARDRCMRRLRLLRMRRSGLADRSAERGNGASAAVHHYKMVHYR